MTFLQLLIEILISEHHHSRDVAEAAVKKHTTIVSQGIMHGKMALRATAMLLDHKILTE